MTTSGGLGRATLVAAGLTLFVVLCTLNSAGYRYGASDQAFYAPAVIHALHPDRYPRDAPLIEAQAHLTIMDEAGAALVRISGLSLPACFALLYTGGLVLFALGVAAIARSLALSGLATVALLAALTLRHAIAQTGTNTLEGYFHPRQLAFACGVWAIAAFLQRRVPLVVAMLALASLIHPTTALWFILWVSIAAIVADRKRLLLPAAIAAGVGAAAAVWALTRGPLAGRLGTMDAEWLATLATKNYLFPLAWPVTVWLLNLLSPALVVALYLRRRAARVLATREEALVAGNLALLLVFLAALPLHALHVQLAIQLQPARAFWMMDFLATVYVVWWLADRGVATRRRAAAVAAVLTLLSIGRGLYIARIAFPTRSMFAIGLPDGDWSRAMAFARQSPPASHWLADPSHALLYGTSVRVAGERDVFVEIAKDQAIGMYDRATAMRTRDRLAAIGDFHALTPARLHELAAANDLDYLVTTDRLDLPVAFSSGTLTVYRLR